MPRRLLALLAARAITTATASLTFLCLDQCTCIGDDCGYASTGETVAFVEPTTPTGARNPNVVPCRDDSDCENASPREGPYYDACWTVADGFPAADLPVSYCAEDLPRRRLRFSNYVDDRCFLVEGGEFYTDDITLAGVGAEEADEVFTCAAASLAGVPPSRVVLTDVEQGSPSPSTNPQVTANFFIAVRGEAEALEVQTRLKYGDSEARRALLPVPVPPPPPPPPSGGNERATEAIKECAVTRSAVWQGASVDPFVAPPRVVPERAIPADVQGCCCGASPAAIELPPFIPVPPTPEEAFEEAFEEPPAPPPTPMVMITSTTMTTAPYSSTTSTSTTAPMVMTTTTTMTTAPYSSTTRPYEG